MLFRKLLKTLIRAYAYLISPLTGPNCRFYPTCSQYAAQAVDRYGAAKGGILAVKRILKCHPWHRGGGVDPVPENIDWPALIGYKRANAKVPQNCGCDNHQMKE